MSIIKQIEISLRSLNQATFQDLMNHFLHLKGYSFISAPGSVVGKEKTSKGQPDAFFQTDEGYAFAEYTTQEKVGKGNTFIQKLEKDIQACFDEADTGIPGTQIKKVILACTDKILPAELKSLSELVYKHNSETTLEVFSIQRLAFEIVDFPGLAERYLGIANTKGQIKTLSDFLDGTSKGIQPSLTNPFLFRGEEMNAARNYLNACDVLIISGKAGSGKSKLATVIAGELEKDDLIAVVIESSGVPLWDDLPHIFHPDKGYVVVFDDANKAVNNLEYLLSYIESYQKNPIKLIITVRDYVRDDLNNIFLNRRYNELSLDVIKDNEMSEIVKSAVPVLSHYHNHLEKIVGIAKGNPRVALMAAYSVQPGSDVNYLKNPVLLYEKYFSKVSTELHEFKEKKPLEALAIIAFFGVLDRSNQKIEKTLKENFSIAWDELWDTLIFLHRHELVDIHRNQVCKISDQVLATYAFYEVFINPINASIPYGRWLITFIDDYEKRVKNSLIDINNTFGYDLIKEQTASSLNEVVEHFGSSDDKLYRFLMMFWYYRETDSLIYVRKWVAALEKEDTSGSFVFTFKHNDHVSPAYKFALLVKFWTDATPYLRPALVLGLDLLFKQPSRLPEVLKFLYEDLAYKISDFDTRMYRQNELLDILCKTDYQGYQQEIVDGIFLKMTEVLLGWDFTEYSNSRNNEITIRSFHLIRTPELASIRSRVLLRLSELLPYYDKQAMKALYVYSAEGRQFDGSIIEEELPLIQGIVNNQLDVTNYSHCRFVSRLKKILEKEGKDIPGNWRLFIEADILKLGRILKNDVEDRMGLTRTEIKARKTDNLRDLITSKSWDEVQQLLEDIERLSLQEEDGAEWWIAGSATEILVLIAEENAEIFLKAIELVLKKPLRIPIRDGHLVYDVIGNELVDINRFYDLISKFDYASKRFWKSNFFHALPKNRITAKITDELLITFTQIDGNIYFGNFPSLMKYDKYFQEKEISAGNNVLTFLAEGLLKLKDTYRIDLGFHCVQECARFFKDHLDLLKRIYYNQRKIDRNFDHDGKELESVLTLDPNFFIEYLNRRVVNEPYLNSRFEEMSPVFIWRMTEHTKIITEALNIICTKSPYVTNFDHPANVLFKLRKDDPEIKSLMHEFLESYIKKNSADKVKMEVVLNVVVHNFSDKLLYFLKLFLTINKDPEIVKKFQFTKGGVFTGSRVPIIQKEIDLYNEIISMVKQLPDMLDYAEHIRFFEKESGYLKREIIDEQRRDFRDLYD